LTISNPSSAVALYNALLVANTPRCPFDSLLRLSSGLFLLVYFYFALSDTLDPSLTHTPLAHALDPSLTHMPFAPLFCLCTDHIYYYKYLAFMSVDTQFIITCSTLRITPYLSEANQVYSLSHLTLA